MPEKRPASIYTLPLFPLHHVQFPFAPIQLYIFEERYKVMLSACIERDAPFGIILIKEGAEVGEPAVPHEVGCITRVIAVKRLDDGRMYLWAAGEGRFRLLEYVEADLPYLLGRVEDLEDAPSDPTTIRTLTQELSAEFLRYLALLAAQANLKMEAFQLPEDAATLTFAIASVAAFSQEAKQSLLSMTDPQERIQTELDLLRNEIAEMEQKARQEPASAESSLNVVVVQPMQTESESRRRYREQGRN